MFSFRNDHLFPSWCMILKGPSLVVLSASVSTNGQRHCSCARWQLVKPLWRGWSWKRTKRLWGLRVRWAVLSPTRCSLPRHPLPTTPPALATLPRPILARIALRRPALPPQDQSQHPRIHTRGALVSPAWLVLTSASCCTVTAPDPNIARVRVTKPSFSLDELVTLFFCWWWARFKMKGAGGGASAVKRLRAVLHVTYHTRVPTWSLVDYPRRQHEASSIFDGSPLVGGAYVPRLRCGAVGIGV